MDLKKTKFGQVRYGNIYTENSAFLDESFEHDLYFTATYETNVKDEMDRFIIYFDGVKKAETYYGSDSYVKGMEVWNKGCPFFLGVCPWTNKGELYYLKGLVYTTRLYTEAMTGDQVKNSYDMTLKYRSSFLGK